MIVDYEVDDAEDEKYLQNLADDEESDDEMDALLFPCLVRLHRQRNSSLFRKRWDSSYLINLAVNEGSFLSEYRVDPGGFDVLLNILGNSIQRNDKFSKLSMSGCGSAAIIPASRLGAALIRLM